MSLSMDSTKNLSRGRRAIIWTVIIQLGLLCGVEGVFLATFASSKDFQMAYKTPTAIIWGLATSLYPISAAVGSIAVLYLSCFMASITQLTFGVELWLIGYLVAMFVHSVSALMVTRVLKGLAIGIITSVLPVYVEKIAPRKTAAQMLTALQAAAPLGTLICALVGNLKDWGPAFNKGWAIAGAPVFPVVVLVFYLPREPSDRVNLDGRCDNMTTSAAESTSIKDALCRFWPVALILTLFGRRKTSLRRHQARTAASNSLALNPFGRVSKDFSKLFGSHRYLVALGAASLAQIGYQFTGINVLMYFMHNMCLLMGFSVATTTKLALGLYGTNMLGTTLSLLFVNKLPRNTTLKWSAVAMAVIHGAIWLTLFCAPDVSDSGKGAVSLCFLFVFVFAAFFSAFSLVYTSEIVPSKIRGTSIGLATAAGWTTNFAISLVAPTLIGAISYHIFLVLCYSCALLHTVFVAVM